MVQNKITKKGISVLLAASIAAIITILLMQSSLLSSRYDDQTAFGLLSHCKTVEETLAKTHFKFVLPPPFIKNRSLQCSVSTGDSAMFAYSSSILNKEDVSSIQPQKVILVRVVDMTANGTVAFDAKQHINSLQYEVSKNRPDLKPQMVSINGNPAWGTEGGDNAGIVVVKYANGTEFSRYTQPAPSSLLLIMGNIEYQIDGYVPLNELEQFAESIK